MLLPARIVDVNTKVQQLLQHWGEIAVELRCGGVPDAAEEAALRVGIGAMLEQKPEYTNSIVILADTSRLERSSVLASLHIHVSPSMKQLANQFQEAAFTCCLQRRAAASTWFVQLDASFQQPSYEWQLFPINPVSIPLIVW
jgi:hypothetical protein